MTAITYHKHKPTVSSDVSFSTRIPILANLPTQIIQDKFT